MFFSAQLVTRAVHRVQEICFTRTKRIYKIAQVHGNEVRVWKYFTAFLHDFLLHLNYLQLFFLTIILYKAVQLKLLKDINSSAVCP